MAPDLLVLGHIVKDIVPGGWQPGGTVYYAAAQARRLGLDVAVVTSCAPDVEPPALLPGIDWHVIPSNESTTFENRYVAGHREQRLLGLPTSLSIDELPEAWREAPIWLLGPVFHELDASFTNVCAPARLVGACAQGWLRRREGDRLLPGRAANATLPSADVVFVSEEDVVDTDAIAGWATDYRTVVLTRGRQGATAWHSGRRSDLPSYETDEVDPTGAGDVFAAAFMYRLRETNDALDAARFAAAAGALSVRASGIDSIAGRAEIEALMRAGAAVRSA